MVNALDEAPLVERTLRGLLPAVARIDVETYDNRIVVGGPAGMSGAALRAAARARRVLGPGRDGLCFRSLPPLRPGTPAPPR